MARKKEQGKLWRELAQMNLRTAILLYDAQEYKASANRFYYAAYHAGTAICVEHGDTSHFPLGWNNPTHEQLPGLLRNNGNFLWAERESLVRDLRFLRSVREDADYRPGRTVDKEVARNCLRTLTAVMKILGV